MKALAKLPGGTPEEEQEARRRDEEGRDARAVEALAKRWDTAEAAGFRMPWTCEQCERENDDFPNICECCYAPNPNFDPRLFTA